MTDALIKVGFPYHSCKNKKEKNKEGEAADREGSGLYDAVASLNAPSGQRWTVQVRRLFKFPTPTRLVIGSAFP